MKTPISYYGGKQQLAKKIVSLIPEHKIYCEPFCGGAAVLFAKEPSQAEVINDTNAEIINFYQVVQEDFPALQKEIMKTLHSREMHRHARVIYENPDMFDTVKRAWAVWVQANMSFGNSIGTGFAYEKKNESTTKNIVNKIDEFTDKISNRIRMLQIENCDALKVIASRDTADTFHYIDPPYVGTHQGHYDGYTQQDFDNLLGMLQNIQGKFLLSSFRNKALMEFTKKNNWYCIELKMASSLSAKGKAKRMTKIEVLTANYPIGIVDGEVKKTLKYFL
ncbi:DNA adenine methylase [Treponema phagedenis]|uniref:DNA adenine methylase n=1 Tax=Treponema phagedenis TaxID=162 RepID=A0AAE6IRN3_TREPH|nr:DNA adenine methylase [Treponema phagedenis]QEJ97008.1 DNA adenine methylase [Treponema phagedenis]QEK02918.1 DNA adenine methylase [Treponema phagedenis]QEK08546.1 DNA adenine methylase [Treponema phagedenis]